jgi:hypothetical protein
VIYEGVFERDTTRIPGCVDNIVVSVLTKLRFWTASPLSFVKGSTAIEGRSIEGCDNAGLFAGSCETRPVVLEIAGAIVNIG